MHVRGAADAHLQHAAAPHRDPALKADVVDLLRLRETADASGLDVDDPCRADLDRLARVLGRVDRLVEAYRWTDLLLQRRVVDDVVLGQRLLDEQGSVRVHLLEERRVLEPVRGVRIELERQLGKAPPDRGGDIAVPAGLDLDLYALVAGAVELGRDLLEERLDRWLDADGHTAQDPVAAPAKQLREGHVRALREEVPDPHLQRRLGHAVVLDPPERAARVIGVRQLRREQARDRDLIEQPPHRLWRLTRVPGRLGRDALTPADDPFRFDARDDTRLMRLA